jgi:hypothetical protein
MNETQILSAIDRIDCQLSPENLHMDGEISNAQAARRGKQLWAQRNQLEKQLGRKVEYSG